MFARTERLLLRPIWPEDASALYDAVADEAVVRNLASAPWPYTRSDADNFAALRHHEMFPNFMLMLRTNGAPKLIGGCRLIEQNDIAELGYWIARPYWGQGFASEAAKAVVGIAKALGHHKLIASHFIDNPASGRVLHKIGFRASGKIESRYSKGRDAHVLCALFECDLSGEDARDLKIVPALPEKMILRAAA
jgi:RimJ/RimL family protein N-acetyltransferase